MLPDTSGRFGLMQIFDWDGFQSHPAMTTSQIQSEAPYEDTVWGAFSPSVWNGSHPGMYVSRYMLPVEDNNSASGHDLNWWQANHPDWILYACDSNGNATKQLAWAGAYFPDVPLNIDNPAVVQYQMQLMIPYLKANGYNALAADNTDLLNYLRGGNPNFGQSAISGYYGCGYYDQSGNFHKVFGPGKDATFIADMVKWVQYAGQALHNAGIKLIINHPLYNAPTDPNESAMLAAIDATVDENGFTHNGQYGDASHVGSTQGFVQGTIQWAEYAQQHHVAFLLSDYFCSGYSGTEDWNNNAPCNADPGTLPAPQVDWALATYALVNEGGLDVYISPRSGANFSYRSEYNTRYGAACGGYTQVSSNVYERKFQGALVIVNANTPPGTASVTLPTTHSYHDIEGRAVSNPLTVNAADGYVLLTSNGCS